MQKCTGMWDLELAEPVADWRKDRSARLLTVVVTAPTARPNDGLSGRATDEPSEEIDVAGWPAIVPHLYA